MYDRMLHWFRARIRNREYLLTLHADDEMAADGYTIFDVERGVLTGEILERQRNRGTAESKYRIRGRGVSGMPIELVAKPGSAGMVILTVYAP